MTPQTQAIFDAALALSEPERALLVERLLETLSAEGDEMTDDELEAELNRRRAEILEGTVKPVPLSELWLDE
ncbi:MAG TPA: addiction module protein [Gemmataceae bacterium]|nr:addiction module protein [Gemmataceae bacterium]